MRKAVDNDKTQQKSSSLRSGERTEAWFDEDLGILRVVFSGKVSAEDFRRLNNYTNSIPREQSRLSLVDLTNLENPLWDSETRKALSAETGDQEGAKVAVVGVPPTLRVLAKMFAKKRSYRVEFFKTEEKGIAWLKEMCDD